MIKSNDVPLYDAVIVGGGPAGLNAALVLGRACRRVLVIDSGSPRNKAAKHMHGFIGRDGTDPRRLLSDSRAELRPYDVELIPDVVIDALESAGNKDALPTSGFVVRTESGRRFYCRKILFATGMCDELPVLPGIDACYGTSVHHCPYCDGWEHRGKHLLAFGSSAHAATGLALTLRGWSDHVTVISNGQAVGPEDRERLVTNGIFWREENVSELIHSGGKLQGVLLDASEVLRADALFFNTSQYAHCELPLKFGCELDQSGRARTHHRQNTKHPGVFVAGDAAGEVQLVIVAAAEGAIAALAMNREMQDEDRHEVNQQSPQVASRQSAV